MGIFNNLFKGIFKGPLLTAQNPLYLTLSDGTQIKDKEMEILRRLGVNETLINEPNSRVALREMVDSIIDIDNIQTEQQFLEAINEVGAQCEISENGVSAFTYSNNREEYENPKYPTEISDTTLRTDVYLDDSGKININQAKEIRLPVSIENGQVEIDRRIFVNNQTLKKNWRGKFVTESDLNKNNLETILVTGMEENENLYDFLARNRITKDQLEQDVLSSLQDGKNMKFQNKHQEARTEVIPTEKKDEKTEHELFMDSISYKGEDLIDPTKNDERTLYKNILIQMGISEDCLREEGNTSNAFIDAVKLMAEGQNLTTVEDVQNFIELNKGIVKSPNEIEAISSFYYETNSSIKTDYTHVVFDKGITNIEEASKWTRITQDGKLISKEVVKERAYQDDKYIIKNIRKENPTYQVIDSKTGSFMQVQGDGRTFLEESVPSVEDMSAAIDSPKENWEKYMEGEVVDLIDMKAIREEEKSLQEDQFQIGQ